MAKQYNVYVDGVLKMYTAATFEAEFGYKPTDPRAGERSFGGRYENRTFAVDTLTSGSLGETGIMYNSGLSSTGSWAG